MTTEAISKSSDAMSLADSVEDVERADRGKIDHVSCVCLLIFLCVKIYL